MDDFTKDKFKETIMIPAWDDLAINELFPARSLEDV